eukprot:Lankesteria_metandrocarpae@DN8189_c0_g1_i1.p1
MDKTRVEARRKDFKKNFEDPRRRREDAAVQIRKAAREQQIVQKRAMLAAAGPAVVMLPVADCVQMAMSQDSDQQLLATQQFRRMLAVDHDPPIQEVINAGIVPVLIEFLRDDSRPAIQLEAAWTLTNIASGTKEQTSVLTENGAIPIFVRLLDCTTDEVRDQAVWALGNIAGDCPECRDMVLQENALKPLLTQIREFKKIGMLRNAAWALSNLCRGTPEPAFPLVAPALPTLRDLIHNNDVEVLTDATWALSYLLETRVTAQTDQVVAAGVCPRLVKLMTHPSQLVQNPALRSIGQIIAGTHQQTEVVLQAGVLEPLLQLLSNPAVPIKKEASWALSNIAAGTVSQIQALINGGIIEPLIEQLTKGELEIKRECAWALSNAIIGASAQQIDTIVRKDCVKPLCDLLALRERSVVHIALEALDCILASGSNLKQEHSLQENPYVSLVEEADGCTKLEQLQLSEPNGEIYRATLRIMTTYFQTEYDDTLGVEEGMQAGGAEQMQSFGVPVPQGGFQFGGQTN